MRNAENPTGTNFVQMRAEPSLLELCRVQPKLLKYNKQSDCVKILEYNWEYQEKSLLSILE
jgi:hypothetical protein